MIEEGIHIVVGALGGGKSLRTISIAEWFITRGRRVATNINLRLETLAHSDYYPSQVLRVPDKPSIEVLRHLGEGSKKKGEYGLLLLDELGIWMNSRTFGDNDRLAIIRFLIEARKRRWIVIFIAQKVQMIDKQARQLGATIHTCRSTKNIFALRALPKIHFATVTNNLNVKAGGTDFYRAQRLYRSYDTEQRFCDTYHGNPMPISKDSDFIEPVTKLDKYYESRNGYYSLLPPKLLKKSYVLKAERSRYSEDNKTMKNIGIGFAVLTIFCGGIFLLVSGFYNKVSEALSDEELSIAEPISTFSQSSTVAEKSYNEFRTMTIRHHTRIGPKFKYTFDLSDGSQITSEYLEKRGITVKNRGFEEALLIGPDFEYWSVYR